MRLYANRRRFLVGLVPTPNSRTVPAFHILKGVLPELAGQEVVFADASGRLQIDQNFMDINS